MSQHNTATVSEYEQSALGLPLVLTTPRFACCLPLMHQACKKVHENAHTFVIAITWRWIYSLALVVPPVMGNVNDPDQKVKNFTTERIGTILLQTRHRGFDTNSSQGQLRNHRVAFSWVEQVLKALEAELQPALKFAFPAP